MSKEKQIEEMAKAMCGNGMSNGNCATDDEPCNLECVYGCCAEKLYAKGYRKQSEGEWKIESEIHQMLDDVDEELYVECPFCQRRFWVPYEFDDEKIFKYAREHYPYCNCGAKMKGGAE